MRRAGHGNPRHSWRGRPGRPGGFAHGLRATQSDKIFGIVPRIARCAVGATLGATGGEEAMNELTLHSGDRVTALFPLIAASGYRASYRFLEFLTCRYPQRAQAPAPMPAERKLPDDAPQHPSTKRPLHAPATAVPIAPAGLPYSRICPCARSPPPHRFSRETPKTIRVGDQEAVRARSRVDGAPSGRAGGPAFDRVTVARVIGVDRADGWFHQWNLPKRVRHSTPSAAAPKERGCLRLGRAFILVMRLAVARRFRTRPPGGPHPRSDPSAIPHRFRL